MFNYALRQRLAEFFDLDLGEVGVVAKIKVRQLREPRHGCQVGNLVVAEVKLFKLRELSELIDNAKTVRC